MLSPKFRDLPEVRFLKHKENYIFYNFWVIYPMNLDVRNYVFDFSICDEFIGNLNSLIMK